MPLPFLTTLGLTKNEADIYELLLSLGDSPASDIIKESKLKRATVYNALNTLVHKGLAKAKDKNKKMHYQPSPPAKLLEIAESQFSTLERTKADIQAVLPTLSTQYIASVERPIVREYIGLPGIKSVFEDIYSPKEDTVYGCVDLEKSDEAVPAYIVEKLIPLRIKHKVQAKTFLGSSIEAEKVQAKDTESLRESILLNKIDYPLPAEIDVYDDKVAMLSFEKGEFVGIIIQNQAFATSLKSIFALAFEKSKKGVTQPIVKG